LMFLVLQIAEFQCNHIQPDLSWNTFLEALEEDLYVLRHPPNDSVSHGNVYPDKWTYRQHSDCLRQSVITFARSTVTPVEYGATATTVVFFSRGSRFVDCAPSNVAPHTTVAFGSSCAKSAAGNSFLNISCSGLNSVPPDGFYVYCC
jgi:hypothetical protein